MLSSYLGTERNMDCFECCGQKGLQHANASRRHSVGRQAPGCSGALLMPVVSGFRVYGAEP